MLGRSAGERRHHGIAHLHGTDLARFGLVNIRRAIALLQHLADRALDPIGGLAEAITLAATRAGLSATDEMEIVEYPDRKGLLSLKNQLSPVAVSSETANLLGIIRLFSEEFGRPLPYLLPGCYPGFGD